MKRIFFLAVLLMSFATSCYKDNATYTFEINGTDQHYTISYQDKHGTWIENQTVDNGWAYYAEHDSDWRLKVNGYVETDDDSIFVKLYKRTDLIKTYKGKDSLKINEVIQH